MIVRRYGFSLLVLVLVVSALSPMVRSAGAQSFEIAIYAENTNQDLIDTLVETYQSAHSDVTFQLSFFDPEAADAMAGVSGADIVFYADFEAELPIEFECGVISHPYVVLPDLGARYLASEDCGDYVSPETPVLKDFLRFAVGPDGQQIAIELGLLPDVVEVVDQGGVTVSIPQPVRGVVSAYGVATYYVYSVGAGARLQAASYIGVRGPAAQDAMRRVDPNFDTVFNAVSALGQDEINLEETAALGPDIVLASARTQWIDSVTELNIPVLRFEGETPERFKDAMTLIGAVLGPHAAYRAATFNAYYEQTLAEIIAQTAAIEETPRVYFSGTNPLRVASGDMYQTSMIEAAGGESVSAELTGFWNDINLEQVLLWDPDVIFVPTYGGANVEAFTESEEWALVGAVQEGRVYQLPSFISPWDTPLPDSILGIIWMAETLYPDQIDLNCEAQVTTFYTMFYDYAISADEAQGLCE